MAKTDVDDKSETFSIDWLTDEADTLTIKLTKHRTAPAKGTVKKKKRTKKAGTRKPKK